MTPDEFSTALIDWWPANARALPWRVADVTPWGILVSEFMLQQTQVDRVIPFWHAWMNRWPTPAALAAESPGEALRAWGRLGYPRRGLWLHRAAAVITAEHAGSVPRSVDALLALPGVGAYTARAVAVFAYGQHEPVVDTNTRRVIARAVQGFAAADRPRAADLDAMRRLLPPGDVEAVTVNAAAMELGATVCTARAPRCDDCPLAALCEWRGAGYPDNAPVTGTRQAAYKGSDREARGRILAVLRAASDHVQRDDLLRAVDPSEPAPSERAQRAYDSLIADGLIIQMADAARLP